MATDFWIASGAGNWTTTALWSTHNVPGISDDVVIGSSSNSTTVTQDNGIAFINTLKINPNDELSINGEFNGAFVISNGLPQGNFGTLDIENNGLLRIDGGTINNSGLIIVTQTQSSGRSALLLADNGGGTVTLNGAGMVVLNGNDQTLNAAILGGSATSTLINDDNNISGTGIVGAELNIINHGTFETNNFLELGKMQIVGSAGGGSFDNVNLLIADPGGTLILGMNGQTSKIINNDLIELKNSVPNTFSTVEIAGTLFLENNQVLGLGSNIDGNWIVGDLAGPDELILDGGTLAGVGRLGGSNLTVFIEALTYVVCSSGTMTFDPVAATIQPKGVLEAIDGGKIVDFSPSTTNQGTIAALAGGEFDVNGNITNSNGGVVNIGSNSEIILETGWVVSGTIQFTGSNALLVAKSAISTLTTVSGTGTGDSFEFTYLSFFSGEHAVFQQHGSTGTLSVVNSSGVTVTSVTLAGQYASADFVVTAANVGDFLLVETNLVSPTPPSPLTATTVQQEDLGLYAALYGRAAEFSGYSFWIGTVAQQPDGAGVTAANADSTAITLNDAGVLGQAFVNTQSTFFNQTYASLTDSQFINALYVNIGGNAGDPGGITYWANLLAQAEAGGEIVQAARAGLVGQFVHDLIDYNLTPGAAALGLTTAQYNAAVVRQETIDNKIAVSLAYSNASQGPGGAILDPQSVGDAAYNAATAVLPGVTSDPATVLAAITGINNVVAHQDLTLI